MQDRRDEKNPNSNLGVVVSNVSKSFGETRALNGCSFDLAPGEIHAIVGENGAVDNDTRRESGNTISRIGIYANVPLHYAVPCV